ncbi:MAG: hypothetical protein OXH73_03975 [Caldilineaceae bacterium]|nr:hypothetical protein [Caldilineaceae bacterium]
MSLLNDIRTDLVNESASLANTLRKAKILAREINLPEFREWVESELNGYQDVQKIPHYRKFPAVNLGVTSGPFGRMDKNVPIPTTHLPVSIKDFAENLILFEGVGELEAQASGNTKQRKWPPELVMLTRSYLGWSGGMELIDAYQPIPTHIFVGTLDQIKNRLLDFVLGLQEHNITPENMKNQTEAKENARKTFNTYIIGNQNTVASGENVNQTIKTVQKGDSESLLSFLRGLNLGDDDIHEAKEAISVEPTATNGQLGPRVRGWLGMMMEKMASGALTIGGNAGAIVLTQAFKDFYGISPQG